MELSAVERVLRRIVAGAVVLSATFVPWAGWADRPGDAPQQSYRRRTDAAFVRPRSSVKFATVGLIALLALGLLLAPVAADAQQAGRVPRIGVLRPGVPPDPYVEFFRQGLRDLGYLEGKNIVVEYRFGEGGHRLLDELAAELVRLEVDVIVTGGTSATAAAKRATSTIPIVTGSHTDPVGAGLVESLQRPGGNVTGLSTLSGELTGKRMELLKVTVPSLARLAVLYHETAGGSALQLKEAEASAPALGLTLVPIAVRDPADLDRAFAAVTQARVDALFVVQSSMFFGQRKRVGTLAAESGVPSMFGVVDYVAAGGLMSYGIEFKDLYRRAAEYVDRILKGAKPADLPIEQPTKFELAINLKTAKELGLTIPQSVIFRADKLIE